MKNKPLINIITRTHGKPDYFRVLKASINSQYYKNINWIIGSDIPCNYTDYIPLELNTKMPDSIPNGHYFAPYNLHCNTLNSYVREGWVLAVDEDDRFCNPLSLMAIVNAIENENQLLVWKVQITPEFIVPSYSFGQQITACDISGIGYLYHSKHLPVHWTEISQGDYRVAKELQEKGLQVKWINKILTQSQDGPHSGL